MDGSSGELYRMSDHSNQRNSAFHMNSTIQASGIVSKRVFSELAV